MKTTHVMLTKHSFRLLSEESNRGWESVDFQTFNGIVNWAIIRFPRVKSKRGLSVSVMKEKRFNHFRAAYDAAMEKKGEELLFKQTEIGRCYDDSCQCNH
jgi:hypothetical protein